MKSLVLLVLAVISGPRGDLEVSVPTFPNASCPVMGKPISQKLFVDTDFGRVYVCCKGCNKKVAADPAAAAKSAYPKVVKVGNKHSPVSGKAIDPAAKTPVTITLQGREIALASADELAAAKAAPQLVLAKSADEKLVDVGNALCPLTGEAVDPNDFVVIDGRLVHLAASASLDDVKKDPKSVLEKALAQKPSEPSEKSEKKGG